MAALPIAAAFLLVAAGPSQADDELIKLVRGSSYQLLEDGNTSTLRIPLEFGTGLSANQLSVETVDVSLGQLEQPALAEAFIPFIQGQSGSLGPALVLRVKAPQGLRPGTYDVILSVRSRDPEQQRLDIQVTHPAAQLETPPTVVIERTLPFLLWRSASPEPTTLELRETSGQSRVSNITITQIYATKVGSETVSGRLRFDQPVSVKPRSASEEPFSLQGDLPVGTANGSVIVDAPQLQTPVTMNFEVRTRRSLAWLFIVAASGLLIGALTRTWLKNRIALRDAQVRAAQMLATIDRELAQRPDSDFQTSVREIRRGLDAATNATDPKPISDATEKANTDLQTELSSLVTRRKTEQTEFEALDTELRTSWTIPPRLRDALVKARTALAAAATRLAKDDVSGAKRMRHEIESTLVGDLQERAAQWMTDLQPILDFLSHPSSAMDAELVPDPKEAAKTAVTLLDAPDLTNASATPQAALSALSEAAVAVSRVLREVLPKLQLGARDVTLILQQANPSDAGAVTALAEAVETLTKRIPTGEAQPSVEDARELRAAIQTLLDRMGNAILEQRTDASEQERKPIEDLVEAGRYREAAASMAELLKKRPKERALGEVGEAPVVLVPPVPAELFSQEAAARGAAGPGLTLLEPAAAPPSLSVRLYRARRSLLFAQLLQSLLLGVVLLVIAYALYAPAFVGTGAQLAAIFLWAFAIDITVDAVLTAARGTGSPPGPTAGGEATSLAG